jgi:serine/threonine protein phosphatase PrpC
MAYQVYGETDIGCVREANEDTIDWHVDDAGHFILAIVADGMGGYEGGEIASRTTVDVVSRTCLPELTGREDLSQEIIEALLLQAGADANADICEQRLQDARLSRMGTTLVIALAYGSQLTLLHAGDSRCYRVGEEVMEALTHDHSMVQQMLDEGAITEQDIDNVPFRNMLTKAVGIEKDLQYSLTTLNTEPGQQFLLCSDGLFNALREQEIHKILQGSDDISQQVHSLIKQSLSQHASDNVSAILLKT